MDVIELFRADKTFSIFEISMYKLLAVHFFKRNTYLIFFSLPVLKTLSSIHLSAHVVSIVTFPPSVHYNQT